MRKAQPDLDTALDLPHKISILVNALHEQGCSAEYALAGTGLQQAALQDPALRVSARQLLTVFGNAARLSNDPRLAIRAGRQLNIMHFGLYGYALLSSPTPAAAIRFALKYRPLAVPVIGLAFEEQDGKPTWLLSDVLGLGEETPLFRFVLEFQLGTLLSLHEDILGQAIAPVEVSLRYAAPESTAYYVTLLGCQPKFGRAENAMRFAANWQEHAVPYANPASLASITQTCDRLLAEVAASSGLAHTITDLMLRQPGRFPDLDQVAAHLHMASRTLRRRLLEQQTSFQTLLDAVRQQLVINYLQQTTMSTEDIATAVGFSDSAALRRAFRRWTGKSPGAFRKEKTKPPEP